MRNIAPLLAAAALAATLPAFGQFISTYAGGGVGDGQVATAARISQPIDMAFDGAGNAYVANANDHRIRKIAAGTNVVTTIAGTGVPGFAGDGGPATAARLFYPANIAVDAAGNVFFNDTYSLRIRRIDAATGVITTVAGNGTTGPIVSGGPATSTPLHTVAGRVALAVDAAGNLFFAPLGNDRVLRVDAATQILTTFAGGGGADPDGAPAALARLAPTGIALAPNGDLFVSMVNRIYKLTAATGMMSAVGGTGLNFASDPRGDGGPALSARVSDARGISRDAAGNLYFMDNYGPGVGYVVRRIDAATQVIDRVAGGGTQGDGGPATSAVLAAERVVGTSGGTFFVPEYNSDRIRKVEGGIITTFAGNVAFTGDGLPATAALMVGGFSIAFDAAGNAFIGDSAGKRVRKVAAGTGVISTVAGNGADFPVGDGQPATSVSVVPTGVAVDSAGNVFVSDFKAQTIRRVDATTGIISVFAGTGFTWFPSGDGGPASAAGLGAPRSLAFDASGNLYLIDGYQIRRIAAGTNIITTVVGGGHLGEPEGTVPATSVGLISPHDLAFDSSGRLYTADLHPYRYDPSDGTWTRVATTPQSSWGIAIDAGDNVFVSHAISNTVTRIAAADGRQITLAGTGLDPFSNATPGVSGGSGPYANRADVSSPSALAISPAGELYIGENNSHRVSKVTLGAMISSPPGVAWAGRLPNTVSLPQQVVLTQLGAGAAAIGSITPPANFTVAGNTCGSTLAGYASCVVDLTFNAPSTGSFTGTLAISATPSAQSVSLAGAGETSLVTHYYESILRRQPDTGGKQFWDSERTRMAGLGANVNETWFAMSSYFLRSPEYVGFKRNPSDFTTDLYKTFFNRAPDAAGQQFWIDQMANGMPREAVIAQFQHSPEFAAFTQGIFGNTAGRAEIDMVMDFYRGLLARLPDNSGFNTWVQQFRSAQCNANPVTAMATMAEQMSEAFITSREYVQRNRTNAEYVGDLYNAFLRRGGELTGVNAWIGALDSNTQTRKQVRDAFRASSEFQGRVSNVANQGCL